VRGALPAPTVNGDAGLAEIALNVNGRDHRVALDVRTTLLDALREQMDLVGSKKGCDQGQCRACIGHVDGQRVLSCLTLAIAVQGQPVETIEGLAAPDGTLHLMQQAFIDHDGFQCGYCTRARLFRPSCASMRDTPPLLRRLLPVPLRAFVDYTRR
jgi:xanthine dehydrogenase YagT iron-sulfur-binding subunit